MLYNRASNWEVNLALYFLAFSITLLFLCISLSEDEQGTLWKTTVYRIQYFTFEKQRRSISRATKHSTESDTRSHNRQPLDDTTHLAFKNLSSVPASSPLLELVHCLNNRFHKHILFTSSPLLELVHFLNNIEFH